jgi:hypothetical protein
MGATWHRAGGGDAGRGEDEEGTESTVLVSTSGAEIYGAMCADLAGKRPPAREPASSWSKERRKHVLPSPSFFPLLGLPLPPSSHRAQRAFSFSLFPLLREHITDAHLTAACSKTLLSRHTRGVRVLFPLPSLPLFRLSRNLSGKAPPQLSFSGRWIYGTGWGGRGRAGLGGLILARIVLCRVHVCGARAALVAGAGCARRNEWVLCVF